VIRLEKVEVNQLYRIREPIPKSIAILRALQLGDLLCTVPAFRALKTALPGSEISLIGLPWARDFVDRFQHYIDQFIEFPGYPGLPEQPVQVAHVPEFISDMQNKKFGLVLQMQGSGAITNPLVSLYQGNLTAGYYLPGQYCPDTTRFLPYPVGDNEIDRHLQLMEFLGIPSQGRHLEFPIRSKEWVEAHELQEQHDLYPDEYVCIHVGARLPERRWPAERFADVADGIVGTGLKVVLTGVTDEMELVRQVESRMQTQPVNLAGKTSLGSMAAILSNSKLLISNDTGVSHLAAALKVPSIVIFMDSEPKRWAPLDKHLHRVVAWGSAASPQGILLEANDLIKEHYTYAS
jgi:ADP-heptose:LPS heptosyltransferase